MKKSEQRNKSGFWSRVGRSIGPGVITGFSDDDPSGIVTYSMAGARFGLGQLWMALFQLPLMIAVQEMCGRLGLVTGMGLAGVIKKHYSKYLLYFVVALLIIANTINIGADISAIGAVLQMLFAGNILVWSIIVALVIILLEVFVKYKKYVQILKWLTVIFLSYVLVAFIIPQDWSNIFRSLFIPRFEWNSAYIMMVVAFLGTTISPYLFFWQTSEEAEEEVAEGKLAEIGANAPKVSKADFSRVNADTAVGMIFSQAITFFIVITAASTLFTAGIHEITSAREAAEALRPLAGDGAYLLFAIGIIGAGLLGIPVLAGSAGYAVSETFGWRQGLSKKFQDAKGFYGVIIVSTLVGLFLNILGVNPIQALIYAAIINGIVAVPLILLITVITGNKKVMGKYQSGLLLRSLGWLTFFVMLVAAVLMFVMR
ncbi:Nramp family divalent metal transporter [Candidatus Microgenomates bacterium]|nr:Nramp family divalent metal transporter [Candidatus Microgenomates bacterium]